MPASTRYLTGMEQETRSSCGAHVTLSDNDEARVTRCPCGTVHVHVRSSGVTIQVRDDRFQKVWLAVMCAIAKLDDVTRLAAARVGEPIN